MPEEIPTELERTVLEEGPSDGPEAGDGDIVERLLRRRPERGRLRVRLQLRLGHAVPRRRSAPAASSRAGTRASSEPVPATACSSTSPQTWPMAKPAARRRIPPDAALTFVIDVVDVVDVPEVELPEEEPTELQRTVISEGPSDGPEVEDFDTVTVYARGVLSADGTEIENNFGSETPKSIVIGRNDPARGDIAGLSEGLIGARPGDVLQLDIPADLAYGATGQAGDRHPARRRALLRGRGRRRRLAPRVRGARGGARRARCAPCSRKATPTDVRRSASTPSRSQFIGVRHRRRLGVGVDVRDG